MRAAGAVVRIAIVVATLLASTDAALPARYDTVIVGGRVIDGTGRPAHPRRLAIKDGRIVAIGTVQAAQGARTSSTHATWWSRQASSTSTRTPTTSRIIRRQRTSSAWG